MPSYLNTEPAPGPSDTEAALRRHAEAIDNFRGPDLTGRLLACAERMLERADEGEADTLLVEDVARAMTLLLTAVATLEAAL